MSLDITLKCPATGEVLFEANITHNLVPMAKFAKFYEVVWRPDQNEIDAAYEIIDELDNGIKFMLSFPDACKMFDASNGWGTYDQFMPWLTELLEACKKFPLAEVCVSR